MLRTNELTKQKILGRVASAKEQRKELLAKLNKPKGQQAKKQVERTI